MTSALFWPPTVHNRPARPALHSPVSARSAPGVRARRVRVPGRVAATSTKEFHAPHDPLPIRDERGITTAEYAVGTAAGAGLAGLLYKMLTGGFGDKLLKLLYDHVLGLLGIG